jgi:hypothetical protein
MGGSCVASPLACGGMECLRTHLERGGACFQVVRNCRQAGVLIVWDMACAIWMFQNAAFAAAILQNTVQRRYCRIQRTQHRYYGHRGVRHRASGFVDTFATPPTQPRRRRPRATWPTLFCSMCECVCACVGVWVWVVGCSCACVRVRVRECVCVCVGVFMRGCGWVVGCVGIDSDVRVRVRVMRKTNIFPFSDFLFSDFFY